MRKKDSIRVNYAFIFMGVLPTTASLAHRFQFFDVLPDAFVVCTLLIKSGNTIKKVDPSLDP